MTRPGGGGMRAREAFEFPEPPEVPAAQRGAAPVAIRYEDVSQDGRLTLSGLPHALGPSVWRTLLAEHPLARAMRAQGVVPILSRVAVQGTAEVVSVRGPLEAEGRFQLAHAPDPAGGDGAPAKLFLNLWAEVFGARGRTYGPEPEGAGARVLLGRVFAEHVFTRPFAEAGARRVTRLDADGVPPVPPAVWAFEPAETLFPALPAGARPLEAAPRADEARLVFGLDHCDSNQHVNSLVYPRLFLDAALRRLGALGRDTAALLARDAHIAWRKPCFAGQRVQVVLQAFDLDGHACAAGAFVPEDAGGRGVGPARPACTLRVRFG